MNYWMYFGVCAFFSLLFALPVWGLVFTIAVWFAIVAVEARYPRETYLGSRRLAKIQKRFLTFVPAVALVFSIAVGAGVRSS